MKTDNLFLEAERFFESKTAKIELFLQNKENKYLEETFFYIPPFC